MDKRSNRELCDALYDIVRETGDSRLTMLAPKVKMALIDGAAPEGESVLGDCLYWVICHITNDTETRALAETIQTRLVVAKRNRENRDGRAREVKDLAVHCERGKRVQAVTGWKGGAKA